MALSDGEGYVGCLVGLEGGVGGSEGSGVIFDGHFRAKKIVFDTDIVAIGSIECELAIGTIHILL